MGTTNSFTPYPSTPIIFMGSRRTGSDRKKMGFKPYKEKIVERKDEDVTKWIRKRYMK